MRPMTIRLLLLAMVPFLALAPAHADNKAKPKKEPTPSLQLPKPDDSLAPARFDLQLLQRMYDRAKAKRNIGIGLATPGVALTLLGGVAIAFAAYDPYLLSKATEFIAGGGAALAGLAIGIPGIFFWSTGQDDMDVASWRMRQLTP
jgi:hypothetical protein